MQESSEDATQQSQIRDRYCEAMLPLKVNAPHSPSGTRMVWTRCGAQGVERHHLLTRARGGLILDEIGETYHLIDLCPKHHRTAHQQSGSANKGLMIDGYVRRSRGQVYYLGPDEYLSEKYPIPTRTRQEMEARDRKNAKADELAKERAIRESRI